MQEVAGSSAAATIESSAILLPDLSYQDVWLQDLTLQFDPLPGAIVDRLIHPCQKITLKGEID